MENRTFVIMYKRDYEMRCLDTFNHKPEKDGKLLVRVFIFVVILAPFLMGAALYYKRYTKISKKHKLNMFLRYSQLDLIPVKNTDYWWRELYSTAIKHVQILRFLILLAPLDPTMWVCDKNNQL
jgi:hypothetical protein